MESHTCRRHTRALAVFWSLMVGCGVLTAVCVHLAGRIRANIAVQDARTEQQLSTYAQTVLTALEEVENALVASSREQVRRVQLAVALATELYRAGLGTFLNVLDSQRALFASQSDLAQSEATIATNLYLTGVIRAPKWVVLSFSWASCP